MEIIGSSHVSTPECLIGLNSMFDAKFNVQAKEKAYTESLFSQLYGQILCRCHFQQQGL